MIIHTVTLLTVDRYRHVRQAAVHRHSISVVTRRLESSIRYSRDEVTGQ